MQGCFVGQRRDMQATHGHVGTSLSVAVGSCRQCYWHGRHWIVCSLSFMVQYQHVISPSVEQNSSIVRSILDIKVCELEHKYFDPCVFKFDCHSAVVARAVDCSDKSTSESLVHDMFAYLYGLSA